MTLSKSIIISGILIASLVSGCDDKKAPKLSDFKKEDASKDSSCEVDSGATLADSACEADAIPQDLSPEMKALVYPDEKKACDEAGVVYNREKKECLEAELDTSWCRSADSVKKHFKAIEPTVSQKIDEEVDSRIADGYIVDQCGNYEDGKPVTTFIKLEIKAKKIKTAIITIQ